MNKQQRVLLKGLADQIDNIYVKEYGHKMTYQSIHNTKVSHEDMELANQEYDEEKEYTFKVPMIHDVNHFRRLKRQLHKNGSDGVIEYLKRCGFNPDEQLLKNAL